MRPARDTIPLCCPSPPDPALSLLTTRTGQGPSGLAQALAHGQPAQGSPVARDRLQYVHPVLHRDRHRPRPAVRGAVHRFTLYVGRARRGSYWEALQRSAFQMTRQRLQRTVVILPHRTFVEVVVFPTTLYFCHFVILLNSFFRLVHAKAHAYSVLVKPFIQKVWL